MTTQTNLFERVAAETTQINIFEHVAADAAEYVLHEDEGHGWLAVPMDEIRPLLAAGVYISPYSYKSRDGRIAYLEEDCDLGTFIRAREAQQKPVRYTVYRTQGECFIRGLPHFPRGRTGAR